MNLIDSHAHLTDTQYSEDLQTVIDNAKSEGLSAIISAGYDFSSSFECVELSKKVDFVYAAVGLHPENVSENYKSDLEKLSNLAKDDKVVVIGEIGLDYHYLNDYSEEKVEAIKTLQKKVFVEQILLANKLKKPIVVHSRDAMGDTIEILKQYSPQTKSLLHCYSGSLESAKILMKLGFSFSFGGVVTFKNATKIQEVVKDLPIENILLETDCPYMSPVPFRGKRNEPKNVVYVADEIARIKGLTLEKVAEITTENAKKLFKI